MKTLLKFISRPRNRFLILIMIAMFIGLIIRSTWLGRRASKNLYETATAEKGTLVTSVSASGTISSGNSAAITTKASGTVKAVYLTNGATVKKGDKIATLALDEYGLEQQAAAYAAYIAAVSGVKTAQKNKTDADIAMWQAQQAILDAQTAIEDKNNNPINPQTKTTYTVSEKTVIDKTLPQSRLAFDVAEYNYKNAGASIADASAKVSAAWRDYLEYSATLTAPADGVISGLILAPGMVIERVINANTNNPTVTAQNLGEINNPAGQLQATVSLSQMDVIKVAPNQKATLTLDAYSDKTFTGKILSVDTNGSVNSNVTSYPVTLILDQTDVVIYPNMSVTAQIITQIKNDVLLIPTSAITTLNNQATVQLLKANQPVIVTVETGNSNDTKTEILSGLAEGDVVITATMTPSPNSQDDSSSPFSLNNRSGRSGSSGTGTNRTFIQVGGGGPPPGGF